LKWNADKFKNNLLNLRNLRIKKSGSSLNECVPTSAFKPTKNLRIEKMNQRFHIEYNLPLARFTRWRVGGPADIAFFPGSDEELAEFLKELPCDVPLTFLGLGSNVLIRDGGIRGAVVILRDAALEPRLDGNLIYSPAGVATPKFARYAAQQKRSGVAFLAGIPGTLGGALAMNAGCYGDEIWNHVARVKTVNRKGEIKIRGAEDYEIRYRGVSLKDEKAVPEWFLGAWFKFEEGDTEKTLNEMKVLLAKRAASQPVTLPNAGSVFKNPEGDFAGRLIEASGLKGETLGGASVSKMHANFIVNATEHSKASATAADIEQLMERVKKEVEARQHVKLEPEIKILGER
jgi:UDP-N-acetylmuramate dehydrogenase